MTLNRVIAEKESGGPETFLSRRWRGHGGYGEFIVLAVPLILSTGAWSVQHFVDRMFLAWYSPEAVAASMPAGIFNFAIMSLFIGTAGYVSTFVAQYHGAGRAYRIGPALWQGIYVSLLGGLVLLSLIPFSEPVFRFFGHDPIVTRYEVEYFQILCVGGFPVIASSALAGFFSGRGRSWPVMWANILATVVNLGLDYVLIFGRWGFPELGIRGAAIATVLAGIASLLFYLSLTVTRTHDQLYGTVKGWKPDRDLLFRLLRFGFPSGVQFFLDMAGFTVFILLVGRLGTIELASTNIAFNISTLAFMPMIGSGIAVSVLVGRYLGGAEPDRARRSVYSGFHLTSLYVLLISLAFLLSPEMFVAPFAGREADMERYSEIHALTVRLLRFVAIYSIFDCMNIVFASAIKGAGDTRFVMLMLVLLSGLFLVLPTYLAVVAFSYGLTACWLIVSAYVTLLGLAFYTRFLGGKWQYMRVIETPPA